MISRKSLKALIENELFLSGLSVYDSRVQKKATTDHAEVSQ